MYTLHNATAVHRDEPRVRTFRRFIHARLPLFTSVFPTRQFLNEKIPGLPYECLGQFGHVHQPLFRMVVVFNGKVYQGEGSSKKSAKIDAAQNAANDWFKVS